MATTSEIMTQNAALAAARKNGTTATTTTASASSDANSKLTGDFSFFLKMLTTQLQNQDPSEPMDVSQMTQQIATFSGVQQQVATNSNLEKLLSSNKQSQLSTAVSYIGKEIETEGNTGNVVAGQGAFSYMLPSEPATVTLTITNAAGKAVFQGQGTKEVGRNLVVWDGKNSFNGNQEPDGIYTISVTAKDTAGKAIAVDARAVGIVTAVESSKDGEITLNMGDVEVPYSQILAVRSPTRIQTGTENAS